jgi:hypothetical protein
MSERTWKTHPGFPPADLEEAATRIAVLRPALTRRTWPPMTYILIPSVLGAADRLLAWLEEYEGADPERAEGMREELTVMRKDFRREA